METLHNNKNKTKSIFSLIFILFIGTLLIFSKANAILSPQVYFTQLDVSKNNFEPGEKIQGQVSLWNYESLRIDDLVFHYQLLGKEVEGVPTQVIDEKIGEEIFSLGPSVKATKSFSYLLPKNLPKGDFTFRIRLTTSRGEEMGWIDKLITIGGEGNFLILDNYWIIKDGEELSPGGGVDYKPGEIPQIRFNITNNSNFTITGFPKVVTYKRNVGGEVVKETEENDIILQPGETKTIEINLPQLSQPQTYLSEVRIYNKNDNQPISNPISFRWIISGSDDAEILFVNLDKDSYEAGETAEVRIQYTGPAHFEEEGGKGEIVIQLFNEKGEKVGEKTIEIDLKVGEAQVSIPIEKNVKNPKVTAQIIKNGNVLDQYEFEVKPALEEVSGEIPTGETPTEGTSEESKIKQQEIIIGIIVLILIIGFLVYYSKNKNKK